MSDKFHIPHDESAERAVVGGLILDDARALDELPEISLDLFWLPGTRLAMRAILEQRAKGAPCGLIGLTQHMDSVYATATEKPVDGGWPAFLTKLMTDGAYGVASIEYYLGVLREVLHLRRIHGLHAWLGGQFVPGVQAAEIALEIGQRLADAEPTSDGADDAMGATCDSLIRKLDDLDAGNAPRIMRTSLNVWNNAFGGLPAGAYLALGGRPGAGKSAMMEQIIWDLIQQDERVLLFEKDMPLEMWLARMACRAEGVPFWKWQKGYTDLGDRRKLRMAVETFRTSNCIRLHNPPRLTGEGLAAIVRREQRLHDVKAVFLDHVQILHTRAGHMREDLTQHSMAIRESASTTEIPHVVLFQLNREGGKGVTPSAANVKEFDQLFADVDGMAILWRDPINETERPPDPKAQTVHFMAAKNRAGGESQEDVTFDGPAMTFLNQ